MNNPHDFTTQSGQQMWDKMSLSTPSAPPPTIGSAQGLSSTGFNGPGSTYVTAPIDVRCSVKILEISGSLVDSDGYYYCCMYSQWFDVSGNAGTFDKVQMDMRLDSPFTYEEGELVWCEMYSQTTSGYPLLQPLVTKYTTSDAIEFSDDKGGSQTTSHIKILNSTVNNGSPDYYQIDIATGSHAGLVSTNDQVLGAGKKTIEKILTDNVQIASTTPGSYAGGVYSETAYDDGTTNTYKLESAYTLGTEGVRLKLITDNSQSLGLAKQNLVLDRAGGTPSQPAYCIWNNSSVAIQMGVTSYDGIGNVFVGGICTRVGHIENVRPTGTINSSNKTFNTTNTWNVNFFNLWVDGLLLVQDFGLGGQYTVSGTTITITSGPAPTTSILAQFTWN